MAKAWPLVGQNQRYPGQILKRQRGARGKRVVGGKDGVGGKARDLLPVKAIVEAQIVAERKVDPPARQIFRQGLEPGDARHQRQPRQIHRHKREQRRQDHRREILETAKCDRRMGGGAAGQAGKAGKDPFGLFQEATAIAGGRHRRSCAAQE